MHRRLVDAFIGSNPNDAGNSLKDLQQQSKHK